MNTVVKGSRPETDQPRLNADNVVIVTGNAGNHLMLKMITEINRDLNEGKHDTLESVLIGHNSMGDKVHFSWKKLAERSLL